MTKPSLKIDQWVGNGWYSVEIEPYQDEDFLKVLFHLCDRFNLPIPQVTDLLDGHAADIEIDSEQVTVFMDNWSFSGVSKIGSKIDE